MAVSFILSRRARPHDGAWLSAQNGTVERFHRERERERAEGGGRKHGGETAFVKAPHTHSPVSVCLFSSPAAAAAAAGCVGNKAGKSGATIGEERLVLAGRPRRPTGLAPISLRKLPAERRGSGSANGACVPLPPAPCLALASASRLHIMGYRLEGGIHWGSAITHTHGRHTKRRNRARRCVRSAAGLIMRR